MKKQEETTDEETSALGIREIEALKSFSSLLDDQDLFQKNSKKDNRELEESLKLLLKFEGKCDKQMLSDEIKKLSDETASEPERRSSNTFEFIDFILKHKTQIQGFIRSVEEKTFRQSRDLIDNKLAREHEDAKQFSVFDYLDKKDKSVAKKKPVSEKPTIAQKMVVPSLNLSPAEDRLIHTLSLLLSRKSQRWDQKSDDYYMGNYEKGTLSINDIEMEIARLVISPHELYSTYLGRNDYGVDNIQFILNILNELSKKNFLVSLNFPSKNSSSEKNKLNKLRTFLPLFQIGILNLDLTENESQEIDNNNLLLEGRKCRLLFKFGPLFTNNIRDRYVEFPENIHLRIAKAYGKRGRVPQCVNLMRDFLFREKQQKRYKIIRDEATIILLTKLDKMRKEGRKKKVTEMILRAFNTFIEIGLLLKVEKSVGKRGQPQFTIHINPDFK